MSRAGKLFFNISEQRLGRWLKEKEILLYGNWGRQKISPKEWLRTGKLRLKVFKQPDNPMRLIGNYVLLERNKNQADLFKPKMDRAEELARSGNL